jgi:hypothetical protein
MKFICFEIREKQAMDEALSSSLNYPLGPGTVTIDSCLCSPCWSSGSIVKGHAGFRSGYRVYLLQSFKEAKEKYDTNNVWNFHSSERDVRRPKKFKTKHSKEDYAIFAYFLEKKNIELLIQKEKEIFDNAFCYFRKLPIFAEEDIISLGFDFLGFDVIEGFSEYDRWHSLLANEGIAKSDLQNFGTLNEFGLYENRRYAERFVQEMNKDIFPDLYPAFIVEIFKYLLI